MQPPQADAVGRWSEYLHRAAAEMGKRVLALNLDESSTPVVFTGGRVTLPDRRIW